MGLRRRSRKRPALVVLASVLLSLWVVFVCYRVPDRWAGSMAGVGDAESPAVGVGAFLLTGSAAIVLAAVALAWPLVRRAIAVRSGTRHPRRRSRGGHPHRGHAVRRMHRAPRDEARRGHHRDALASAIAWRA